MKLPPAMTWVQSPGTTVEIIYSQNVSSDLQTHTVAYPQTNKQTNYFRLNLYRVKTEGTVASERLLDCENQSYIFKF